MTNRDKLLNMNEYDMLIILQAAFGSGLCRCVIDALVSYDYPCPDNYVCTWEQCEACIARWLNEDVNKI